MAPPPELFIDLETFADIDVRHVGAYRYSEDPNFEILMAAWTTGEEPVQVAIGHEEILKIPGLFDAATRKIAHNAQFERVCLSRLARMPVGTYFPPEHYHDTMAVAGEKGYPLGLDALTKALGGEQKDSAGTRLINLFCKPNRKGGRNDATTHPEQWAQFVEYCRQDVAALVGVHRALGGFPNTLERDLWRTDQRINDRGLAVDLPMARAASTAAEENRMLQELEIMSATGIANPGSRDQMLAWLRGQGVTVEDLRSSTVETLLADSHLAPVARRVLELRQELALVAAKKYEAALKGTSSDGRLRGSFRFFGAHTGRWAGRGVQPHNLPREQMESELAAEAAILDLKMGTPITAYELKALVRPMFIGPFSVADYAAIEARVIAWLADEDWALKAFRKGRDIYVETADRMGGMTRFQGKVAVLALGYGGGVKSLRAMGYGGDIVPYLNPKTGQVTDGGVLRKAQDTMPEDQVPRTDKEVQALVSQWRDTNPAIVQFWHALGAAFRTGGQVGDHIRVVRNGSTRSIVLPSGRAIVYHQCRWYWKTKTWPNGDASRVLQASFSDPRRNGARQDTYGGRLAENVTQAVARDVLGEALVVLDRAGAPVVGHVHDEVLVETQRLDQVVSAMTTVPAWAAGLPIDAEGFKCRRYRKG